MSQNSSLGTEVTYDDAQDKLFPSAAFGGNSRPSHGGGGGTAPPPTLVSDSNLSIDLIWDTSVSSAPSGFMSGVINVAHYYSTNLATTSPVTLDIHIGWGEVDGQSLSRFALGESITNGLLTDYNTLISKLSGYTAASNVSSVSGAQFFLSNAEAKVFTLGGNLAVNPNSVDGYVGFGSHVSWDWNAGTTPGASSYDFQSVVAHELSEVMGRIEMEGHTSFGGVPTYTLLDLFNYSGTNTSTSNALVLSGGDNTGTQVNSYFSTDGGATFQGAFNDGYQGGDIADWASYSSYTQSGTGLTGTQDAYDAFGYPGVAGTVSSDDLAVDSVILLGVA